MIGAAVGAGVLAVAGTAAGIRAARVKGDQARRQYYGGSKEMTQAYRKNYDQGVVNSGQEYANGIGQMNQGVQMAQAVGRQGVGIETGGIRAMATGAEASRRASIAQQNALGMMRGAAEGNAPSQAELMMRAQSDQVAQQQMAMASAARGGNQAAAMRNAGAAGNQLQLQAIQQGGALRAGEMAQAREQYAGLGSQMWQQGMSKQQLGLQQVNTGLGAQQFGAESQIGAGQARADMGVQRESNWLDAQSQFETALLDSRTQTELGRSKAQQAKKDRRVGAMGALVGAGGKLIASGSS